MALNLNREYGTCTLKHCLESFLPVKVCREVQIHLDFVRAGLKLIKLLDSLLADMIELCNGVIQTRNVLLL